MQIEIVDRGRGPQLSTSRVTVQDLFPYFQKGLSHQQIRDAVPTLTIEEIKVIDSYITAHRNEVESKDREIRERNASRKNSPEVEKILRAAREERRTRESAKQTTPSG